MLQRVFIVGLLLFVFVAPLEAVTVFHVPDHVAGWRGTNSHSLTYCFIDHWPGSDTGLKANATVAEFDRTELQTAINNQIAATGGWKAQIVVTQPQWEDAWPIPANLGPVVGTVQVDSSTLDWSQAIATNAGNGNWRFSGTNYGDFVAACNAGVAVGKSSIITPTASQWIAFQDPTMFDPSLWNIAIDIPQDLVTGYIANPAATGFFVSATTTDLLLIYQSNSLASDMRIVITAPEPATLVLLALGGLLITRRKRV